MSNERIEQVEELPADGYDFTDDFLYFYEGRTNDRRSDQEAAAILALLKHGEGRSLLDLGCGSGRIANRIAASGGRVVGLDKAGAFLERARLHARERGVTVEYVLRDMRDLAWQNEFDAIVSWYTSFGYFDDETNLNLLRLCHAALRPGGTLLLEVNNRDELLRNYLPAIVVRRGDDFLLDENTFDPNSGRTAIRRTILRGSRLVRAAFSIRLFNYSELRAWLLAAGFDTVEVLSGQGEAFAARSPRMILLARKQASIPRDA